MYCRACQTMIPDSARFCPECGTPTGGPVVAAPKKRRGAFTVALCVLLLVLVLAFEVAGALIASLCGLDLELLTTFCGALGALLAVRMLGKGDLLVPRRTDLARAWREGWWVVAVSGVLALIDIASMILDGEGLAEPGWALRIAYLVELCLSIGASEEAIFRGVMLQGMLDVFGSRPRGKVVAVVLSSVLFGAAHVSWAELSYGDPLEVMQAVLKMLQTGTYGVFLAALALRTHSLVGPMLLHALDDLVLMIPSVGLAGTDLSTDYVTSGSDAVPTVILYCVIIVAYLPLVWRGIRMMGEYLREGEGLRPADPPTPGWRSSGTR